MGLLRRDRPGRHRHLDRARDAADAGDRAARPRRRSRRRCVALAAAHRDTVMLGRTHGQPGLPITFGFKAAVWAAEVAPPPRADRRRREPRLAVGQLAGAVGTLSAWGDARASSSSAACWSGSASACPTRAGRPRATGSPSSSRCSRSSPATLAKIGNEVYNLQRARDRRALARRRPRASSAASRCRRSATRSAPSTSSTLARVVRAARRARARGPGRRARARRRRVEDRVGVPARRRAAPRRSRWRSAPSWSPGCASTSERMRANVDAQRGYVLAEPVMLALGRARRQAPGARARPRAPPRAASERGPTLREALRGRSRDRRAALAGAARGAAAPGARARRGRRARRRRVRGDERRAARGLPRRRRRAIRSGPAPELVEAGYELELADAPLLARGLGARRPRARDRARRDPRRRPPRAARRAARAARRSEIEVDRATATSSTCASASSSSGSAPPRAG